MALSGTTVSDYSIIPDWSKLQGEVGSTLNRDRRAAMGTVLDDTTLHPVFVVPMEFRGTANNSGAPLVTLDQDNATDITLHIETANTTVDVISAINCDSLTTGGIANFVANSSSTGTRTLLNAKNDPADATGTTVAVLENDSSGLELSMISNDPGATGCEFRTNTQSASAADNDVIARWTAHAHDDAPTNRQVMSYDVQWTDASTGSYASDLELFLSVGAAANKALTLSGGGQLGLDLDSSLGSDTNADEIFDHLDDAIELARMSHDPVAFRRRMVAEGIFVEDPEVIRSGHMMLVQPMMKLMCGGIYQNRWRMDVMLQALIGKLDELFEGDCGIRLPDGAINPA